MMVVSYDVDTTTPAEVRRLRRVAKICETYGCRVQNSVFELLIDPAQLVALKTKLSSVIDAECDSVRLYRLGSNWRTKMETLGCPLRFEQDGLLLF